MRNFKNLNVWQEAMNFAEQAYLLTLQFPSDERFGLTSQLRRSAVSIPSNIAEGCGYNTDPQLGRFLQIAQGSAFEAETQILLAKRLNLIPKDADINPILDKVDYVQKLLYKFHSSLNIP